MNLFRRSRNAPPETHDDAPREYSADEVDVLTARAAELLDELHAVMNEMAQKLRATNPEGEVS